MEKGKGQQMGRGSGKGPMGKPMSPQEEMFAADFPEFKKVERKVDMLVDSSIVECGMEDGDFNETRNTPSEDAEEEISRVHSDIAGYGDPEDTEKEYAGGSDQGVEKDASEDVEGQLESIFLVNEKGEYHNFFKRMMDEAGISSIAQLTTDQKSEFFKKISAGWKKIKGQSVAESFKHVK